MTIVIAEYHIPYPKFVDSLTSAFSWANLNVFQLVQTGCKVRVCCLTDSQPGAPHSQCVPRHAALSSALLCFHRISK